MHSHETRRRSERDVRHFPLPTHVQNFVLSSTRLRWAALQIAALKRLKVTTQMTIEAVMSKLSTDLNGTYARILSPIDEHLPFQASTALKWMVLSARPLFIEELVEACAIHSERTPVLDQEYYRLKPYNVVEVLFETITIEPPVSESMQISNGMHRVTLAHFSVQEFLTSENIARPCDGAFEILIQESHLFIARSFLAYLYYHYTWPKRDQDYPLKEYAWEFGEHGVLEGCWEDVAYVGRIEEGSICVRVGGCKGSEKGVGGLALAAVHDDLVTESMVE